MAAPERILVVDGGDVCAAPHIAAVLRSAVEGRRPAVRVSSAGVDAAGGGTGCVLSSALVAGEGAHRAVPVTTALLRSAALVLVLDLEQRAAINRLLPGRQRWVFTVREAASLALRDGADAWSGTESLTVFAEELHRRRGLVVPARIPVPRRGVLRRPVAVLDPDDLYDGHDADEPIHRWSLEQAEAAARALASALLGRAGALRDAA